MKIHKTNNEINEKLTLENLNNNINDTKCLNKQKYNNKQ